MKQSCVLLQPRTAPTKRLYLRKSPQRRNKHSLERGFYIAEFATGDDPVNFIDLWGLECSASDKVAALGSGTPRTIDDGLKDVLENDNWTYIGDNPDLRKDIHNDLKEKVLDSRTSPYWDVSVTNETTRYLQETPMGETSWGEPIVAGEYVNAEGDLYTVSPTSPESSQKGPVTDRYLDANGDRFIDFQR